MKAHLGFSECFWKQCSKCVFSFWITPLSCPQGLQCLLSLQLWWCRVTPAGGCVELSLPVCRHWRLGSQACAELFGVLKFGKCWLVLSIHYCFFMFTPILNNYKSNQHLCVYIHRQDFRLVEHSSDGYLERLTWRRSVQHADEFRKCWIKLQQVFLLQTFWKL